MAIHNKLSSLVKESIYEYLEISKYCIYHRKNIEEWGSEGCFGYPAVVLLLSIVDAIGSYILEGNTRNHFNILNHQKYYNLNLLEEDIDLIYKHHRCLLVHNAGLSYKVGLSMGNNIDNVVDKRKERLNFKLYLNLIPFLELTKEVVDKFFKEDGIKNIIDNSRYSQEILNKK